MERSLNDRGKNYIAYYLGLYMDLKHHRVEVTTYIKYDKDRTDLINLKGSLCFYVGRRH